VWGLGGGGDGRILRRKREKERLTTIRYLNGVCERESDGDGVRWYVMHARRWREGMGECECVCVHVCMHARLYLYISTCVYVWYLLI